MATAYIAPDADSTDGNWTDNTGGTTLFSAIDEHLTPSDTDYIQSGNNPSHDICKIRLSDPGAGTISGPFHVSYRYGKSGDAQMDLVVRLKQATTTIATWTHSAISATPTTVTQTLSAPELASISDFTDLFLEFDANLFAYQGAGDIVSGATTWCGLRAYTNASIGANAIRLRRLSDNNESDFATVTGGGLDAAAITTWRDAAGASTAVVVYLYDQTGNANHLYQPTNGAQPTLLLTGGPGSVPAINFNPASYPAQMSIAALSSIAQPHTFSVVARRTASFAAYNSVVGTGSAGSTQFGFDTTANTLFMYAGSLPTASGYADSTWHSMQGVFNGASSVIYADGTSNSVSPGAAATGTGVGFGTGGTTTTNSLYGDALEMGLWSSALSGTQQANLDANQQSYWGI